MSEETERIEEGKLKWECKQVLSSSKVSHLTNYEIMVWIKLLIDNSNDKPEIFQLQTPIITDVHFKLSSLEPLKTGAVVNGIIILTFNFWSLQYSNPASW